MQAPRGQGPSPIGIVYNTSMTRPDAALALAAMYPMEGNRESRMGSVCVVGAGYNAAVFCDIIAKMYSFGTRNGNQELAVGLAVEAGVPDSPRILLLPGSRVGELQRHLPPMLAAWNLIHKKLPNATANMVLPNESLKELATAAQQSRQLIVSMDVAIG